MILMQLDTIFKKKKITRNSKRCRLNNMEIWAIMSGSDLVTQSIPKKSQKRACFRNYIFLEINKSDSKKGPATA